MDVFEQGGPALRRTQLDPSCGIAAAEKGPSATSDPLVPKHKLERYPIGPLKLVLRRVVPFCRVFGSDWTQVGPELLSFIAKSRTLRSVEQHSGQTLRPAPSGRLLLSHLGGASASRVGHPRFDGVAGLARRAGRGQPPVLKKN
jgi:hypothetical protein